MPELSKWIPPRSGYWKRLSLKWVKPSFMPFAKFRDARRRADMTVTEACEWCSHVFEDDEMLALACPSNGSGRSKNLLLCQTCAHAALRSNDGPEYRATIRGG